ncbi:MAG: ABC transporter ATP-binding protein [Bacteroidales bacterium]
MKTSANKILSLDSLKIGYASGRKENVLLPPLTASANSGELVAVIGRNGIGKSTLLRTLTGLQKPLGGDIFCDNKNVRDYSRMEFALKVGYISTEIVKVSNMSVYDLVALGRFPHTNWIGRIELKDHEVILDALKKTSMELFSRKLVSELSDGERQKSMIARILAQDTSIMIMDEPTAFLDIAGKYEIFHLMHKLSRNSDKTIIFSTHDLQMAISQSDKIWLILDNNLIEGAPEDLMIAGAFDNLFNSSNVFFNSEDGTFISRSDTRGSIYIEGEGAKKYWTERAINRAGFTVSKERVSLSVIIPSETYDCWRLSFQSHIFECSSLYELISCLSGDVIRPI